MKDGAEVTLTTPDKTRYPLPDPCYLAFHAALAKVVHASGIAEALDKMLEERENIRVLSDDSAVDHSVGQLRMTQKYIVTH